MDEERNFTIEPEEEPEWEAPMEPETPEEPKRKRRTWLKVTALLLAVAIIASVGRSLLRSAIKGLETRNTAADTTTAVPGPDEAAAEKTDEEPYQRALTPLPEELPSYDGGKTLSAQEVYALNVDAVCGIATEVTTNVFGQAASTAVVGSGFVLTADG